MNSIDLVPHAWNNLGEVETLGIETSSSLWGYLSNTVPHIYDSVGAKVLALLKSAESLAKDGNYANLPHSPFSVTPGCYNWQPQGSTPYWIYPPSWEDLPSYPKTAPVTTDAELEPLIIAAHTCQYTYFFGIQPIPRLPAAPKATLDQVPEKVVYQRALQAAARLSPLNATEFPEVEAAFAAQAGVSAPDGNPQAQPATDSSIRVASERGVTWLKTP